jgi:MYXO-CTERM domain-containing protein
VIYVTSPDPLTPEDQMRMLRLAVVGSLLSVPAIAAAENNSSSMEETYAAPVQGWMVAERPGGVQTVRQVLPADRGTNAIAAAGDPLIIYVNKNGVTLSPGDNDSRTNRSTLVDQTTAIPAYSIGATQWTQIMSCFRKMYEPFNVTVTDVDPGNVPHMESIVTTLSSTIGMDPNVGGVSPYTIGCTAIPNSIVFTFGQAFNNDPETICEVMAQETAHSIGLDHEMLASDPLTYLQYNGLQSFKDQTVSCGEFQNRACGLQGECGATQNSYQVLMTRVGPGGGPNGLPTVAITSPANGATVPPGFSVTADASDDGTVNRVELYVDGTLVSTKTTAPFTFQTASNLSEGAHQIRTVVYDDGSQNAEAIISVTVQQGAPDPDPDTGGDGDGDGNGNNDDDPSPSELTGGCQTSGGTSGGGLALLGITLAGLIRRRRR